MSGIYLFSNCRSTDCFTSSSPVHTLKKRKFIHSFSSFIHSFHWHVQNSTIPCCSQELIPFLSVMYIFLPPFLTNYSSIISHPILPSISWSTTQSCCSQIHIYHISRPIRRTVIFSLEILEKNNDKCILILVIYWKKTELLHTKISNHNIIYSS